MLRQRLIISGILIGILIIIETIFLYVSQKNSLNIFYNQEYNGVIDSIIHVEGRNATTYIKINKENIDLGIGYKIEGYINIGDSIIKKANSYRIRVVRKKSNGEWYEKIF